jgi:hypothetical protein
MYADMGICCPPFPSHALGHVNVHWEGTIYCTAGKSQQRKGYHLKHCSLSYLQSFLVAQNRLVHPHCLLINIGKTRMAWFVVCWWRQGNGRLHLHIVTPTNKGESGNEPGARSMSNICPPAQLNIYPTSLGKISLAHTPFSSGFTPYVLSSNPPLCLYFIIEGHVVITVTTN